MAKASSGALSTFVTSDEGRERVQAYKDAQESLRQALDNRQNQLFNPTLLAISQALGSPTKTGSFGEVIGNVAGAVGTAQQAEEKRAREAAAMRFELAQQGLQSYHATQGDKIFNEVLARGRGQPPAGQPATPPEGQPAQPGIASGQPPAEAPGGLRSITTDDIAMVGRTPNGVAKAEFLLKLQDSERGRFKTLEGQIIDLDAPGGPKLFADFRNVKQEPTEIVVRGQPLNLNMTPTELREFTEAFRQGKGDEYYDKNLKGRKTDINLPAPGGALVNVEIPLLGDEFKLRVTPRQAAMIERYSEEALKTGNPTSLRAYVESLTKPMAMPAAPTAAPAPAVARPTAPSAAPAVQTAPTAPGQPPMPAVTGRPTAPQPAAQPAAQPAPVSDLSRLPLADQEKIMMERITKSDLPAQETATVLQTTATPSSLNASDRRMRELDKLVASNPQVVGLMNKQGFLAAIGTAANEGFRAGPYTVSLPVKEFIEKLTLNPEQQATARRIAMILDEEFFNRAALAKSALGPQISNADSILMKSPMARPEDAPQLIRYWALHGQMVNRQNDELYRAYNSWLNQTGGRAPARQFFDREGRAIINKYTPFFEQLQDKFNAR
jgi:hypothetical protein